MKRSEFFKSLGIGSLLLIPGVKSATDEPKEVVKYVSIERSSLIPQARYSYNDGIIRYLHSAPNDSFEWEHFFAGAKGKIALSDSELLEVRYIERMYPPKV